MIRQHCPMLVFISFVIASFPAPPAFAQSSNIAGAKDSDCLACHGDKSLNEGKNSRLHIPAKDYSHTSHTNLGCFACHPNVGTKHPTDKVKIVRLECTGCHSQLSKQFEASYHAAAAKCTDCHNPHKKLQAEDLTCSQCHSAEADDYGKGIHAQNATCMDCHNPHTVGTKTISAKDMTGICAKCHHMGQTVSVHERWLPQADLHLEAMPCITCHTSSENYKIQMYVEKESRLGTPYAPHLIPYEQLAKFLPSADKPISSLIDKNGDNKISLEELRNFNLSNRTEGLRLWGMMVPEKMKHNFQILDNRWDCTFCHSSGPTALQTSYVSFPNKTGGYDSMPVEKGAILDILYGTPDFYMMGTTRNSTLSIIGGLIILGGLSFAGLHGTVRFLTRHKRKGH